MADPTIKRRRARGRSTRSRAGERGKASDLPVAETEQASPTRGILVRKMVELTEPIMEQYGEAAFDEVMTRMEATIQEFTQEVRTLFSEMVQQSREEHERLKAMLVQDEAVEEGDLIEEEQDAEMSEFEKRLERMEQSNESKSTSATKD